MITMTEKYGTIFASLAIVNAPGILNNLMEILSAMNTNRGFTLIELMIVTSIIVIIAAIAIPALLSAKLAANESNATGSLKTLANSESTFQASS